MAAAAQTEATEGILHTRTQHIMRLSYDLIPFITLLLHK